jgi:TolB protein
MRATRVVMMMLALGIAARADAQVTGSIFGAGSESFPIAVLPLKNLGGDNGGTVGQEFSRVLTRDLELSGYFRLIDPKTFVEDPQQAGLTAETTDFVGWAALGASEVVKGGVTASGDGVKVEVHLFDVPGRKDVPEVGRAFNGARGDVARMAHKTADRILEVLTGERGPFDSKIALTSTGGGPLKDVYTYTFDQSVPTKVTNERTIIVSPRWGPQLRSIVFTSYAQHEPRLFSVELTSRRVAPLLPNERGNFLNGAWSPDGSMLLVTREVGGNSDIWLYDRSGAPIRRLTDHWAIDVSPAWAPDNRTFAFCSARGGAPQIYVMTIDGGSAPRRVSTVGSYNTSPAWSPKGDLIAYATRAGGGFQIVVQPLSGGGRTITSRGSNEDPTWSPDGRYVVYSSSRSGRRKLWLSDRDGRTEKQLTMGNGDDTSPAWSPRLE